MDNKTLERLLRGSAIYGAPSASPFRSWATRENGHGYGADELGSASAYGSYPGFGNGFDGDSLYDEVSRSLYDEVSRSFASKATFEGNPTLCSDDSNGWVYGFEPRLGCGYRAHKQSACGNFSSKARGATDEHRGHKCSCPSSLKGLAPISIAEMQIGETHYDCVLLGTVCNQPEVVNGMLHMSVKDRLGMHVDVSMHFNQDKPSQALDLKKAYPVGEHIAIKNPCLRHTSVDNATFILVWNPRDTIEKLEKLPSMNPEVLLEDALLHATDERWDVALQYLTKCIDMVGELKDGFYTPKATANESSRVLVDALSTQAKVFYYTYCYEEALRACDQALKIDPQHCKSLYRKGLALEGLFRFEEACTWLECAANRNAGKAKAKREKKINAILRSCRKCCSDNQNGRYADLARYLLHTYKPEENGVGIPSFSNHLGPVEIRLVGGGKGRGMFASKNVKAGDVLLVSNAMAICYQRDGVGQSMCIYDNEFENLVSKVESMENLQHALSYMAGSGCIRNTSCTSEVIALAESCVLPSAAHDGRRAQMEKDRIKDIVKLNAFGPHRFCELLPRHEYACKYVNERDYLGLWFLPSFINHSCVSNASRLVIGNAMFVHAACDIKAREEITLPYFDTLMPLKQRNEAMRRWGFSCHCKRCTFEQTLQTPLRNVAESFERVYRWITETIVKSVAVKSLKGFGDKSFNVPISKECEDIRAELGNVMLSTPNSLVNDEKHMWMMASYSSLVWYQSLAELNKVDPDPAVVALLRFLVDSMQCVAPGHIRTLVVVGTVNVSMRMGMLEGPALAIGKSVFGAQEPHVIAELVRVYASVVPFP